MSRQQALYGKQALHQWTQEVAAAFPQLSQPQARGLAAWAFGMVLAKSCALTAVALFLGKLLKHKLAAVRERLRDLYREAPAKAGHHRRDLDVTTCFGPLLRWVLRDWKGRQLAVAVDASTLGSLFTVLCIRVVYRGCALPVAWKIVPATVAGAWKDPWLKLLEHFHGLVPGDWQVIVLADRGLYAKWLFAGIRKLSWHPLLRINQGGKFRPQGWGHFVPLTPLVPCVGRAWRGQGTAFATKAAQLPCTLLACWEAGHAEAWLILTDLPPQQRAASWYGLRSWIEQFFKDVKRGGWQGQHTRMTEAARAERLWLAIAVATLWLVRVGGADEVAEAVTLPELQGWSAAEQPRTKRWRLVSVFARGWTVIIVALINQEEVPLGTFLPEPWPLLPEAPETAPAQEEIPRAA